MKIGQMLDSKYLKRSDLDEFDGERVVTIVKIGQVNIAKEDETPEMKWAARFSEFKKPLLLNSTNIQLIAMAVSSDDTDDWIGKQVTLYDDPNITFGGKLVGGLRIKKAGKKRPVEREPGMDDEAPAPRVKHGSMSDDDGDEIPF